MPEVGGGHASPAAGADEGALALDGFTYVDLLDDATTRAVSAAVRRHRPIDAAEFYASPANDHGAVAAAIQRDVAPLISPAVEALLPGYRIFMVAATIKGPRSGVVQYHQDWTYTDERREKALFLWCPLVDVDDRNGVLRLVPGSHRSAAATVRPSTGPSRWQLPEMFQVGLHERSAAQPMSAGQAVLFEPSVAHGSLHNTTDDVRPAITVALAPDGAQLLHFHDDGRELTGHLVEERFFTEHDYATRPDGPATFRPWAPAIGPDDFRAMIASLPPRAVPGKVVDTPPPTDADPGHEGPVALRAEAFTSVRRAVADRMVRFTRSMPRRRSPRW